LISQVNSNMCRIDFENNLDSLFISNCTTLMLYSSIKEVGNIYTESLNQVCCLIDSYKN
jgi:aminoglycoside N3'-acetyltransferase